MCAKLCDCLDLCNFIPSLSDSDVAERTLKAGSMYHYSEHYFLMAAEKVAFASNCFHKSVKSFYVSLWDGGIIHLFTESRFVVWSLHA